MSAVCPVCGVAVVPGYVRCPKCHAGLPTGRMKRVTGDPGGTAVVEKGFPFSAVLGAIGVAAVIILVFGFRGTSKKTQAAPVAAAEPIAAVGAPRPPRSAVVSPAPVVAAPVVAAPVTSDPRAVVAALEDVLRRARLWGRAEVSGARVDVRSGSCGDKAMRPTIESEKAVLRGAGLTKLRCLEQSGAVVFERDL
ncbi:MAG: hypothetical protein ABIY55_35115 [Kofleriaceae bacterium]